MTAVNRSLSQWKPFGKHGASTETIRLIRDGEKGEGYGGGGRGEYIPIATLSPPE